jgi:hypothetical protein
MAYENSHRKIRILFNDISSAESQILYDQTKEISNKEKSKLITFNTVKKIVLTETEWLDMTLVEVLGGAYYEYKFTVAINGFPMRLLPFLRHSILFDGELDNSSYFYYRQDYNRNCSYIRVLNLNENEDIEDQVVDLEFNKYVSLETEEDNQIKIKLILSLTNPQNFI